MLNKLFFSENPAVYEIM